MSGIKKISLIPLDAINFAGSTNIDIEHLNTLIENYNRSTKPEEGIDDLKRILRYKQKIENSYGDELFNRCLTFSKEMQIQLFTEIQTEFAKHGVSSLYGVLDQSPALPPNNFSEILSNMPPQKINDLMSILAAGNTFDEILFQDLYQADDKGYHEFRSFLQNNGISFLGGNHSLNFKITPNNGGTPYVLKIADSMGMTKLPIAHLREKSSKVSLPLSIAERQSTLIIPPNYSMTRTVLITEFFAGGDLVAHSQTKGIDDVRIESALDIYKQMLDALIDIDKNGCAFPDMKNNNWMITPQGKLMIGDTKSLIFREKDGTINYTNTRLTSQAFLHTLYMDPPEFDTQLGNNTPISADAMHAFMLGKNLYQYLTLCKNKYLERNDSSEFNFHVPVFKTPEGQKLAELIKKLICKEPKDRLSLADAKHQLNLITIPVSRLKIKGLELLAKIESPHFGTIDEKTKNFIAQNRDVLKTAKTPEPLMKINQELEKIIKQQEMLVLLKIKGRELITTIESSITEKNVHKIKELIENNRALLESAATPEAMAYINQELEKIITQQRMIAQLRNAGLKLLTEIESLSPAKNDDKMKKFIEQQGAALASADTPESFTVINQELEKIVTQQRMIPQLKMEGEKLLTKFTLLKFGYKDDKMKEFIEKYSKLLTSTHDSTAITGIIQELKKILNQQKIAGEVQHIIADFRGKDGLFTIGMSAKADRIEQAMCEVPVESRGQIMDNNYQPGLKVQLAIASHRLFTFFQSVSVSKEGIDEKTAAKSYITFKERLKEIKLEDNAPPEESQGHNIK